MTFKRKTRQTSFINATRCRHNHKIRYELNVSKNDLFTDSVNMNILTSLNKFIFLLSNFFSKRPFTHHIFCLFSYSVICILNCLFFNVRCVLFHFFHAIVKFCVVSVVGIIKRAIPVNYERTSTEITKLHTNPTIPPTNPSVKNSQMSHMIIGIIRFHLKTEWK